MQLQCLNRAANLGTKLEWLEDSVKTVMGPIPAIKFDKTRQHARKDPVKAVTFGDGKLLPADIIYDNVKNYV
ncbi:clavaminate synthase-like protein [Quercus suber]|uniref:Clavaminate synthase-like protein n=1 Tax=Quercus suber TaxID=58331 RepID=A0AAW0KHP2_QUESU